MMVAAVVVAIVIIAVAAVWAFVVVVIVVVLIAVGVFVLAIKQPCHGRPRLAVVMEDTCITATLAGQPLHYKYKRGLFQDLYQNFTKPC